MYQTKTSLTPLVGTDRYGSEAAFAEDRQLLRDHSWQLVGASSDLRSPGDNLAVTLFDVPVLVRNCDGELKAFRNVCAHRHCKLFDDGTSHSDTFKCRYHGWHYGSDGQTRKLPGAKNFPHFDREQFCLAPFAVETCGQLVFVRLHAQAPTLQSWLGEYFETLATRTDVSRWTVNFKHEYFYEADWKIPVEGSLESYHLGEVHAATFGHDPGEENTEHNFHACGSDFVTHFRGNSVMERLEEWSIRSITGSFDTRYQHIHVMPNVMASVTDSISLVYQILPVSPGQSMMRVIGLGPKASRLGPIGTCWAMILHRTAARIADQVLREDAAIFPHVQAGISSATRPGIFGRCEERLHAFHQYLAASEKLS